MPGATGRRCAGADVVWTHTESQHLAVAALFKAMPKARRPKLLAQSVWLMDRWDGFGMPRKALYRWLIAEAGVLTFHSPLNRDKAKTLFPGTWCEVVPFGVCTALKQVPTAAKRGEGDIRIFALGNDRHRDWATLLAAFANRPGFVVKIASGSLSPKRVAALENVEIVRPSHNTELLALYRWADVVALPLQENLHASGATVLQEAVLAGRPTVCTRTGGLDTYFSDDEIAFVPVNDADAMPRAAAHGSGSRSGGGAREGRGGAAAHGGRPVEFADLRAIAPRDQPGAPRGQAAELSRRVEPAGGAGGRKLLTSFA